jgi:hypothetical protein
MLQLEELGSVLLGHYQKLTDRNVGASIQLSSQAVLSARECPHRFFLLLLPQRCKQFAVGSAELSSCDPRRPPKQAPKY